MKAMILAAGRGERMRPLTDNCPKPMLRVAGIPLLEHHITKLSRAGFNEIIINHAWCGEQIEQYFGNGEKWGVHIQYSAEKDGALETAGGIVKALPKLIENEQTPVFLVVNGDIYTDFEFINLPQLSTEQYAHLWLVKNPEHNLAGDFQCIDNRLVNKSAMNKSDKLAAEALSEKTYTFSGIGLYHASFFDELLAKNSNEKLLLGPMLRNGAAQGIIGASLLEKFWTDVGTPERLTTLNNQLT